MLPACGERAEIARSDWDLEQSVCEAFERDFFFGLGFFRFILTVGIV